VSFTVLLLEGENDLVSKEEKIYFFSVTENKYHLQAITSAVYHLQANGTNELK
jgi:hypothetical protein